jgi:hypothetical protein
MNMKPSTHKNTQQKFTLETPVWGKPAKRGFIGFRGKIYSSK